MSDTHRSRRTWRVVLAMAALVAAALAPAVMAEVPGSSPSRLDRSFDQSAGTGVPGPSAGYTRSENIGDEWEIMAPLPQVRAFHATAAWENYIYVIGGADDTGTTVTTVYRYDTGTDTWDTVAQLPVPLESMGAAALDGKIYVPGDSSTAITYVYDIATDTWSNIPANNGYSERLHYAVVAHGDEVWVLGGMLEGTLDDTTEVWILDTATEEWSAGVPLQRPRFNAAAAVIDGEVYVAGGLHRPGFVLENTTEKFDGADWSFVADIPDGAGAYDGWGAQAYGHGADGLWMAGGIRTLIDFTDHAAYYDPDTGLWTDSPTVPELNQGRFYVSGVVAEDGYFYVIGGLDAAFDEQSIVERLEVGYPYVGPTGVLEGTVTSTATGDPIAGAVVTVARTDYVRTRVTDAAGFYQFGTLPVEIYDVSVEAYGFEPDGVTDVEILEDDTVVVDFELDPLPEPVVMDGYVTDFGHGWPLYATVVVTLGGNPIASTFTDPFTGYFVLELLQGYNYDFVVTSLIPGYIPAARVVAVGAVGHTELFVLMPDALCNAPGYSPVSSPPILSEGFDDITFPPAGWEVFDVDGVTPQWASSTARSVSAPASAFHNYSFSVDQDGWLVSPEVAVPGQGALLKFWEYTSFASWYEKNSLWVCTSSCGAPPANYVEVVEFSAPVSSWREQVVSLAPWAGQTVRFAFRYEGYDAHGWYIDNVTVEPAGCDILAGGLVAGFVNDGNTMEPLVGATVADDLGGSTQTVATPLDLNLSDGFYLLFVPIPGTEGPATRTFTASMPGYGSAVVSRAIIPNSVTRLDFVLGAGWLEMNPTVLDSRVHGLDPDYRDLQILNYGALPANVSLLVLPKSNIWVPMGIIEALNVPNLSRRELAAVTSEFVPNDAPAGETILTAGAVVNSWATGLVMPWGTGFHLNDGTVWANDNAAGGGDGLNHEFSPAGVPTGRTVPANFGGTWPGDMAFDPFAGTFWQVNVGGDNCIHEWHPNTGATGNSICWGAATSERGLAYDPMSDTFFVGGWNTTAVTRFDRAGSVLATVNVGLSISGLAYNPTTGHLFAMTNAAPNLVHVLDVNASYAHLGSFPVAGFGDNHGAGLHFDCQGYLWASNMNNAMMVQFESGEVGACPWMGLPWLILSPDEGVVPGNGSLDIDAIFLPEGADSYGLHRATIMLNHDTPYDVNETEVYFTKAFDDIPYGHWADAFIHGLAGMKITRGCGFGKTFCPDLVVDRTGMAIFLTKMLHGADFEPPPAVGIFADVNISDTDVTADYIEQIYNDGITAGCATGPGGILYFCPNDPVTRAQMAVFVVLSKGWDLLEPTIPTFGDVPIGHWAYGHIERFVAEGVTAGCGGGNYCPDDPNTRAELAVFLVRAWDLPYFQH